MRKQGGLYKSNYNMMLYSSQKNKKTYRFWYRYKNFNANFLLCFSSSFKNWWSL
jgi:hypothetical protein